MQALDKKSVKEQRTVSKQKKGTNTIQQHQDKRGNDTKEQLCRGSKLNVVDPDPVGSTSFLVDPDRHPGPPNPDSFRPNAKIN